MRILLEGCYNRKCNSEKHRELDQCLDYDRQTKCNFEKDRELDQCWDYDNYTMTLMNKGHHKT